MKLLIETTPELARGITAFLRNIPETTVTQEGSVHPIHDLLGLNTAELVRLIVEYAWKNSIRETFNKSAIYWCVAFSGDAVYIDEDGLTRWSFEDQSWLTANLVGSSIKEVGTKR